jgi:hypothetical protein
MLAVRIVQHDELAVVAPLHHMVRVAGQGDTGQAGHERRRRDAMSLETVTGRKALQGSP